MMAWWKPNTPESSAEVPAGTRVYALGDCHGCSELLRAMHAAILEDCRDLRGPGPDRLVAVYLGDYIDRGPDSRGVLDLLIDSALPGFEAVYLMGNHDRMLLDMIDDGPDAPAWRMNGADETLSSYGIGIEFWSWPLETQRAALREALPASHKQFLRGLRMNHIEGGYFFVHAGVRPGVALEAQTHEDMLWIRGLFLKSAADHGKVVVHGHSPVSRPESLANRIGIDTGAVYGGELTALVLEDRDRRFLSVA